MPIKAPLGRLESVSLRDYWVKEDTEFTPWLADAENFEKEVGHSFDWIPSDDGFGHGLMTFDFDHLKVDDHPKFFNMVAELLNNLSGALSKRHLIFS